MYAADNAFVGPTELFECGIGFKQGYPASPLLFSLHLDGLEKLLEEGAAYIDCPMLTEILLAILLIADDIALFSHSGLGLQKAA